jgi:hypothetical protein
LRHHNWLLERGQILTLGHLFDKFWLDLGHLLLLFLVKALEVDVVSGFRVLDFSLIDDLCLPDKDGKADVADSEDHIDYHRAV